MGGVGIEGAFALGGLALTVAVGFVLVPTLRKAMSEGDGMGVGDSEARGASEDGAGGQTAATTRRKDPFTASSDTR